MRYRGAVTEISDNSLEANVFARDCSSRETLQTVTGRWGSLVLTALGESNYRFSALRRRVDGVSERMLSQTLQNLERDGMLSRHVFPEVPPRVEYQLTALGRELMKPVCGLVDWLERKWPEIRTAREKFDARQRTGARRAAASRTDGW